MVPAGRPAGGSLASSRSPRARISGARCPRRAGGRRGGSWRGRAPPPCPRSARLPRRRRLCRGSAASRSRVSRGRASHVMPEPAAAPGARQPRAAPSRAEPRGAGPAPPPAAGAAAPRCAPRGRPPGRGPPVPPPPCRQRGRCPPGTGTPGHRHPRAPPGTPGHPRAGADPCTQHQAHGTCGHSWSPRLRETPKPDGSPV
ncbi:transcription initiation factor TFIID subunit 4-like [Caloenas nicobarica]|uniref:transcription initiation factor TFIID subunit 4-like n=1 Tax=Caloenas nicobarica TaxID=187106 RepID=UPI0032B812E0